MNREAWQATIHRVAESRTRLKQLSTTSRKISKLLEVKIFTTSLKSKLAICITFLNMFFDLIIDTSRNLSWRRQWHPTPVLLPGKSHRQRSLVGCSPWLLRVGHDWVTSLSLFIFMHWRRKWQPTPVFLNGESWAQGSLVGCRLWGRTESDTTEAT